VKTLQRVSKAGGASKVGTLPWIIDGSVCHWPRVLLRSIL